MKKRLLATVLSLCLLLGMLPATALAADETITPDYDWYTNAGADATEYTISTAAELFGFANIANGTAWEGTAANTFEGKTIKLGADIDLNGATWTPVGAETAQFSGTFDGQQHTIKNFVLGYTTDSDGYQYCGFFNWINWPYGSVCNLTLRDITATIGANGRFGTVACYVGGGDDKDYTTNMMHDVHVENVTVTSTSADARVGGMFCRTSRSFKDCTVKNLTVNVPNGIVTLGGFVSFVYANNQHFQNCSVDGFKVNAANCNDEDGIGGFAGYFNNSYGWTNFFESCTVSGLDITVSGTESWVGGFAGCPCANIIATDCSAKGKINASGVTGGFVGGFMGNFGWKAATGAVYSLVHQLKNSTADVDIVSGGAPAGGFIGSASCSNGGSKYGVFENCTASGNVTNTNGAAGGFAGEAVSGQYTGCEATGNVEGKISGGFIGEVKDYTPSYDVNTAGYDKIGQANEIKLSECEASGTVIGSECAGGLIGNVGEKTSPDEEGSKGKLIVTNSTASATVVGTGSTTQVAGVMNNSESEKIDSVETSGNSGGTTVVPPENETITVNGDGSIEIPAGSTVNGKTVDDVLTIDNSGEFVFVAKIGNESYLTLKAALQAAENAGSDVVITLLADATFDWGSASYENSGALILRNKTIVGASGKGTETITFKGYGSANPIKDLTLKNLTVKDETVGDNEDSWEHGYLECENLTAENISFIDGIQLNGTCTLTDCKFANNNGGMYQAWVNSGNITFSGCEFDGERGLKIHEAYGSDVTAVKVDGCSFDEITNKPGIAIGDLNAKTNVLIANSTFTDCKAGDAEDDATKGFPYIYESDTDVSTFDIAVCGNTITVDGNEVDSPDHNWQLTSEVKPTYDKEGSKTYTCDDCGTTKTETVPALTRPSGSSGSDSDSDGTYAVSVEKPTNGTVTATPGYADKGDNVTITVKPKSGYELDELTVTDKNGKEISLKDKGNGKYTFTMPASKVTVKASFTQIDASVGGTFTDVSTDAYYYDAVEWAVDEGITSGTSATTFSPNASCTRAQAVTFLWRAAGSPAPKSSVMPFTDVKSGAYYYDAVLWAVEQGITAGTTATTFSPDATCTRAQIVTFLWRSQESPAAGTANPFTDVAADAYYADAVLWAVENDITAGTTATTFSPNNDCTRAQIVTFLYRAAQ